LKKLSRSGRNRGDVKKRRGRGKAAGTKKKGRTLWILTLLKKKARGTGTNWIRKIHKTN